MKYNLKRPMNVVYNKYLWTQSWELINNKEIYFSLHSSGFLFSKDDMDIIDYITKI